MVKAGKFELAAERPYLGLKPFGYEDAEIFFGRDRVVEDLIYQLRDNRCVHIVGPSGCGKSSVAKAGLIPELEAGGMRDSNGIWSPNWRVAIMRPGNSPRENLARSIFDAFYVPIENPAELNGGLSCLNLADDSTIETHRQKFVEHCLADGIGTVLNEVRSSAPEENFLLVVDQFEEVFRILNFVSPEKKQVEREALNTSSRSTIARRHKIILDQFAKDLIDIRNPDKGACHLVTTMRIDFLSDCSLNTSLLRDVTANMYMVSRMNRSEAIEAITQPALQFGASVSEQLQRRLYDDMVAEASADTGTGRLRLPDQLPLLQHSLSQLWEKEIIEEGKHALSIDGYFSLAEIANSVDEKNDRDSSDDTGPTNLSEILSKHVSSVFDDLDVEQQSIAQKLFLALTEMTSDERADIRRPRSWKQLVEETGCNNCRDALAQIINIFSHPSNRFLVALLDGAECKDVLSLGAELNTPEIGERLIVDISHESLLRHWGKLIDWIEKEKRDLAEMNALYNSALLSIGSSKVELSEQIVLRHKALCDERLNSEAASEEWFKRHIVRISGGLVKSDSDSSKIEALRAELKDLMQRGIASLQKNEKKREAAIASQRKVIFGLLGAFALSAFVGFIYLQITNLRSQISQAETIIANADTDSALSKFLHGRSTFFTALPYARSWTADVVDRAKLSALGFEESFQVREFEDSLIGDEALLETAHKGEELVFFYLNTDDGSFDVFTETGDSIGPDDNEVEIVSGLQSPTSDGAALATNDRVYFWRNDLNEGDNWQPAPWSTKEAQLVDLTIKKQFNNHRVFALVRQADECKLYVIEESGNAKRPTELGDCSAPPSLKDVLIPPDSEVEALNEIRRVTSLQPDESESTAGQIPPSDALVSQPLRPSPFVGILSLSSENNEMIIQFLDNSGEPKTKLINSVGNIEELSGYVPPFGNAVETSRKNVREGRSLSYVVLASKAAAVSSQTVEENIRIESDDPNINNELPTLPAEPSLELFDVRERKTVREFFKTKHNILGVDIRGKDVVASINDDKEFQELPSVAAYDSNGGLSVFPGSLEKSFHTGSLPGPPISSIALSVDPVFARANIDLYPRFLFVAQQGEIKRIPITDQFGRALKFCVAEQLEPNAINPTEKEEQPTDNLSEFNPLIECIPNEAYFSWPQALRELQKNSPNDVRDLDTDVDRKAIHMATSREGYKLAVIWRATDDSPEVDDVITVFVPGQRVRNQSPVTRFYSHNCRRYSSLAFDQSPPRQGANFSSDTRTYYGDDSFLATHCSELHPAKTENDHNSSSGQIEYYRTHWSNFKYWVQPWSLSSAPDRFFRVGRNLCI